MVNYYTNLKTNKISYVRMVSKTIRYFSQICQTVVKVLYQDMADKHRGTPIFVGDFSFEGNLASDVIQVVTTFTVNIFILRDDRNVQNYLSLVDENKGNEDVFSSMVSVDVRGIFKN